MALKQDKRKREEVINWEFCIICQDIKEGETLRCPHNNAVFNNKCGIELYEKLAKNIKQLSDIDLLPPEFNATTLLDNENITDILAANKASWHRKCYRLFEDLAVTRAVSKHEALKLFCPPSTSTKSSYETNTIGITRKTRSKSLCIDLTSYESCLFCDLPPQPNITLTQPLTFDTNARIQRCANDLKDAKLLAKLSFGDIISRELKYHPACLTKLYNRHNREIVNKDEVRDAEKIETATRNRDVHQTVITEIVNYVEENSSEIKSHKLADLRRLYIDKCQARNVDARNIRSTDLAHDLLNSSSQLHTFKLKRDIFVALQQNIAHVLHQSHENDVSDAESKILNDVITLIRSSIKNSDKNEIPQVLIHLINGILYNHKQHLPKNESNNDIDFISPVTVTKTITQLIKFNFQSKKAAKNEEKSFTRHSAHQETSVTTLLPLLIYAETRSKSLIEKCYELGLGISHKRLMTLLNDRANDACEFFHKENLVCPPQLRKNIFTSAAVDNLDHDPQSTFAKSSFHGTAITIQQQPEHSNSGQDRSNEFIRNNKNSGNMRPLPEKYTVVPYTNITGKNYTLPIYKVDTEYDSSVYLKGVQDEVSWLNNVNENYKCSSTIKNWPTFHSLHERALQKPNSVIALLPMFEEYAASYEMILHTMNVVRDITQYLNSTQIPILYMDNPLYKCAKIIQWTLIDTHGEDKFVIMPGGLHIEMAMINTIGKYVAGSGWTTMLSEAGVFTEGRADNTLRATHVTRARYAHQVTVAALHTLLLEAYNELVTSEKPNEMPKEEWCTKMSENSKLFKYWFNVYNMEINILLFVRSLREGNFDLYRQTLENFVPWFFALDQHNYARWVPVHLRDMKMLHKHHPLIHAEFMSGNFVGRKTQNPFSAMSQDQIHEQVNATIKSDSGILGITANETARARWPIIAPEISELISTLQRDLGIAEEPQVTGKHHLNTMTNNSKFEKDVQNTISKFRDTGNPFLDVSGDLYALDTKTVVDVELAEEINNLYDVGVEMHNSFVEDRLETSAIKFTSAVTRNNPALFSNVFNKEKKKVDKKIKTLQNTTSILSRFYFISKQRKCDLQDLFNQELQDNPPSISDENGELRICKTKLKLLSCIEQYLTVQRNKNRPVCDVIIFDAAAMVHMIKPSGARTVLEYGKQITSFIAHHLNDCSRVDFVFDVYKENSIKNCARVNRGVGVAKKVTSTLVFPNQWEHFLKNSQNKEELFKYLADCIGNMTVPENKTVWCTKGVHAIACTDNATLLPDEFISPCTHEEADTRVILHARHAVLQGYKKVMVRTVDTDVVVLCVAYYFGIGAQELHVDFGTGENRRYIAVHEIANSLGQDMCTALPIFHALTGTDTTSMFATVGKVKAWNTWKKHESFTSSFKALAQAPANITDELLSQIEKFVIYLYDITNKNSSINKTRLELFKRRTMQCMENIPPSHGALVQHIKRAVYQGGHIWGHCLTAQPDLPDVTEWGWKLEDSMLTPLWTTVPKIDENCMSLIRCRCTKRCSGACSCSKSKQMCTEACYCNGLCYESEHDEDDDDND